VERGADPRREDGRTKAPEVARRPAFPDPPGYETERHILAGLSGAQRAGELRTGARLVHLPEAPYFRYTREHLPPPARTGEMVSERPVRDEFGRVVARRVVWEQPDGEVERSQPRLASGEA